MAREKPIAGLLIKELNIEMQKLERIARLEGSKYAIRELTEKEKLEITEKIGIEAEVEVDEERVMKERKEDREEIWHASCKGRNTLDVIETILQNKMVVDQIQVMPNKKGW